MINFLRSLFVKQSQGKLPYLVVVLAALMVAYGIRRSAVVTSVDALDQSFDSGGQADSERDYPKQVFAAYEKAVQGADHDPVDYENLATAVFEFRTDAQKYFGLKDEQAVINRAVELYHHALELDPASFPLAKEIAENYYMIKPLRADEGVAAWKVALKNAASPEQREEVYLNLARFNNMIGRLDQVRPDLEQVHASTNLKFKESIMRSLAVRESAAKHHVSTESTATGGQAAGGQ